MEKSAKTIELSRRQRKLFHILKYSSGFLTGAELARRLNVSERTIRYDIEAINRSFCSGNACIQSVRSKGFRFLESPAPEMEIQTGSGDYTGDDRIRHLVMKLCLAVSPILPEDLEEDFHISRPTLDSDLRLLRHRYCHGYPYLTFIRDNSGIRFAPEEQKIRETMNRMLMSGWDYAADRNPYYSFPIFEKQKAEFAKTAVSRRLREAGITIDDPSKVSLTFALVIMDLRVRAGFVLPDFPALPPGYERAYGAVCAIFQDLENEWRASFGRSEKDYICLKVLSGQLPSYPDPASPDLPTDSPVNLRDIAGEFLKNIRDCFGLDFSADVNFLNILLHYIYQLSLPVSPAMAEEDSDQVKIRLLIEYEIAGLFEELSESYFHRCLSSRELYLLSSCVHGALEKLQDTHPDRKIRTVLCCHRNMPAAWVIQKRILAVFKSYLLLTEVLPVNLANSYDFSHTELLLCTVDRPVTTQPGLKTIFLSSPDTYADYPKISSYIRSKQLHSICTVPGVNPQDLMETAFWHEKCSFRSSQSVIGTCAEDFIHTGLVPEEFAADIRKRERISSAALRSGIVFLYSLVPSKETRLSVMLLEKPVSWNTHKIHIAVTAAFRPEHRRLLFLLLNIFYHEHLDPADMKQIRTKEDFCELFRYLLQRDADSRMDRGFSE